MPCDSDSGSAEGSMMQMPTKGNSVPIAACTPVVWGPAGMDALAYVKQAANRHKEVGNSYFEARRYQEAACEYCAGLQEIEDGGGPLDQEVKKLKICLALNMAACGIKLENCEMTLQYCHRAFEEPNMKNEFPCLYLKALFRQGQVLRLSGDYRRARRIACEALRLSPGDAAIQQELRILNGGITYCPPRENKANIFAGVFDKMKIDSEKDEIANKRTQRKRQRSLLESGDFGGRPTKQRNPCSFLRGRELGQPFRVRERVNIMEEFLPNSKAIVVDQYRGRAYSGQYSHDGSQLFTTCQDWNIRIYKTGPQGVAIKQPARTIKAKRGQWTITDAAMSRDGMFLVYSSITPIVHLVNLGPDDCDEQTVHHRHHPLDLSKDRDCGAFGLWCVRISGDGRELISGSSDHSLYLHDIEADKVTLRVHGHEDDVNAVVYADAQRSNLLFSGGDDSVINVWDTRCMATCQGRPAGLLVGHLEGITCLDSKGDGIYLVSNGKDQTAKLWDIRMMSDGAKGPPPRNRKYNWDYRGMSYPGDPAVDRHPQDGSLITFRGHSVLRTLIRCRFSPAATTGQRYIYTGSADGLVYIYDLSGDVVQILRPPCEQVGSVARDVSWHPNNPVLTCTSWGGMVSQFVYTEHAEFGGGS